MTTKELLYAQNYIEQFIRARRDAMESGEVAFYWALQRNPFDRSPENALYQGFIWSNTREGHDVWRERRTALRDTYSPPPLF